MGGTQSGPYSMAGCNSPALGHNAHRTRGVLPRQSTVNIDRNVKEFSRYWGTGVHHRPSAKKRSRPHRPSGSSSNGTPRRQLSVEHSGTASPQAPSNSGTNDEWQSHMQVGHMTQPMPRSDPRFSRQYSLSPSRFPSSAQQSFDDDDQGYSLSPSPGRMHNSLTTTTTYANHNAWKVTNDHEGGMCYAPAQPHNMHSSTNNLLTPEKTQTRTSLAAPRLQKQRSLSPHTSSMQMNECGLQPACSYNTLQMQSYEPATCYVQAPLNSRSCTQLRRQDSSQSPQNRRGMLLAQSSIDEESNTVDYQYFTPPTRPRMSSNQSARLAPPSRDQRYPQTINTATSRRHLYQSMGRNHVTIDVHTVDD